MRLLSLQARGLAADATRVRTRPTPEDACGVCDDRVSPTLATHPRLVAALDGAVAIDHPGTAQHCSPVGEMAARLGEAVGLDGDDLEALAWAQRHR